MVNYVTGLRLACPVPIRANPCQSMPIRCQSGANFLFQHKFANLPIVANPCQSVPIHANPVPILCQSGANFLFQHKFANLPIVANPCQSVSIRANPCQSVPIRCQFVASCQSGAIPDQCANALPFGANRVPILKEWFSCCYALVMD